VVHWLAGIWAVGGVAWLFGVAWLVGVGVTVGRATTGFARLPRLVDPGAVADAGGLPSVSVVVAARNEAASLGPALSSLLASDYPRLEVIAVDDRSTDGTAAILEALARRDPRLRVLRLTDLPAGWLGKNRALQRGAEAAGGDWLLFTDADVRFAPAAIRAAVVFAERARVDHLTALPAMVAQRPALRLFMVWMLFVFTVWQRPWQAAQADRRESAGFGAFNLVRRQAYWEIGGHAALPLALADDVVLGAVLKAAGYRQTLAVAAHDRRGRPPLLELQWYPDVRAAVRGFEKNAFAMFGFRTGTVAACAVLGLACAFLPPVAVVLAPAWRRLPWLAAYMLTAWSVGYAGRSVMGRFPWAYGLLYPLAQVALVWTVVRSAALALTQGGVRWRDTFYPLEALRAANRALRASLDSEPARQIEDLVAPRH
jgi:hypothetical protein